MTNYCIISHQYKFIYIPIPKVGCTTLLNRVAEIIHAADIYKVRKHSHRDIHTYRKEIFNHQFSEISHDVQSAIKNHPDYFTFAFTRNPFSRVQSCYVDKLSHDTYGYDNNLIKKYPEMFRGMPFKSFLETIRTMPFNEMDEHFRPQHTFLPLDDINFLGKIENFSNDWYHIESHLNLAHVPLPQFNKTESVDYYTPETEDIVRDVYRDDFLSFGYSTKREQKSTKSLTLPLSLLESDTQLIHPFKDVFIEKEHNDYVVKITGVDSRIIIPHFSIRYGKGVTISLEIESPRNAQLCLYFTTKDDLETPESQHRIANLHTGYNSLEIHLHSHKLLGRFRLKLADKPGLYRIKSLNISEFTLPWFEDVNDLSEINKKIFDLPEYTQNHKNLFSMVNYASLFVPIINIFNPKSICEIGCDAGNNSLFLAQLCESNSLHLNIVDPIRPTNNKILEHNNVTFFETSSVEYLKTISTDDTLFFIDGDHNYNTVKEELDIIESISQKTESPLCLFLHDTSWPWAYRDLIYSPDYSSENAKEITSEGCVSLYSTTPESRGLPILDYSVSVKDGGENNGVKKAIEVFLSEKHGWDHFSIPSLYGLTILWTTEKVTTEQENSIHEITNHFKYFSSFLSILEWNRLALYCHTQDLNKELQRVQQELVVHKELLKSQSFKGVLVNFKKKVINLVKGIN